MALREGEHPTRLVGDGHRSVIPNAVVAGRSWGSAAAAEGAFADWYGVPPAGPWLDRSASEFWGHLHARLTRYLGGLDPAAPGYQTVIVVPRTARPDAALAMAQTAGFEGVMPVSSTEAAVAGWLVEQLRTPVQEKTIAIVALGDVSAEAAAFIVETGEDPAIVASTDAEMLEGSGSAYWVDRILRELDSRLSGAPSTRLRLPLWQAAREFGARLRRSALHAPVRWNGPLEDRLTYSFSLSAGEFAAWPEVMALAEWLPPAVERAVQALDRTAPDVLLVTGAGAEWPVPSSIFADLPVATISDRPAADIACGAVWHPEMQRRARAARTIPSFSLPAPEPWPPPDPAPEPPRLSAGALDGRRSGELSSDEFTRLLDRELNDLESSRASDG
jgi:hypothetical protein